MYRNYKKRKNENNLKISNQHKHQSSSLEGNVSYSNDSLQRLKSITIINNTICKNDCNKATHNEGTKSVNDALAMINEKDKALNESCCRLREAIMNKTRELFNSQNDFCSKTIRVLQNSKDEKQKKQRGNVSRTSSNNSMMSPRRTRSSTIKGLQNSKLSSQHHYLNESCTESNYGAPIMCSTFNNHHCNIHKSCNREVSGINNIHIQRISLTHSATQETPPKDTDNSSQPTAVLKPLIMSIQPCSIFIDRLEVGRKLLKNTIIQTEPMELTEVQGKYQVSQCDNSDKNKLGQSNLSMCVNTSLDVVNRNHAQDDEKKSASVNNIKDQGIVKDVSNTQEEKNNTIPVHNTTIYCNTINFINSPSVVEVDPEHKSVIEIPKDVTKKDTPLVKDVISAGKNIGDCSLVENTPESKSIISRSQIMHNTIKDMVLKQQEKDDTDLEKTIVLDDLPLPPNLTRNEKGTVIIEESSDDENSKSDESDDENSDPSENKNSPLKTSTLIRRRKLFTQHSSPISITCSPATQSFSPMVTLKQTKKNHIKRKRMKHNNLSNNVKRSQRISQKQLQSSINTSPSTSSSESIRLTQHLKPKKKKRLIKSKKIAVKNPVRSYLLSALNNITNNESNKEGSSQIPRGSDVFMVHNKILKRRKTHNIQNIIIASTGLSNRDKELVKNAVRQIAGAKMEHVVTRKTTHVVTTGAKTINLLRGIIRGCWIVKLEWVKRSMEIGRWLNAEKYEIEHFSKAIKENRRDREIFGSAYVSELFTTCGLIYIEDNTTPPREILKELIKTAGGSLTEDRRKAKVIVGPEDIKEVWVLDSITSGKLQSINQYKI